MDGENRNAESHEIPEIPIEKREIKKPVSKRNKQGDDAKPDSRPPLKSFSFGAPLASQMSSNVSPAFSFGPSSASQPFGAFGSTGVQQHPKFDAPSTGFSFGSVSQPQKVMEERKIEDNVVQVKGSAESSEPISFSFKPAQLSASIGTPESSFGSPSASTVDKYDSHDPKLKEQMAAINYRFISELRKSGVLSMESGKFDPDCAVTNISALCKAYIEYVKILSSNTTSKLTNVTPLIKFGFGQTKGASFLSVPETPHAVEQERVDVEEDETLPVVEELTEEQKALLQRGAGEASETTVIEVHCKLYKMENGAHKDFGVNSLKINRAPDGKCRFLARQDRTGKETLNARIDKITAVSIVGPKEKDISIVVPTIVDGKPEISAFTARVKDQDIAKAFKSDFDTKVIF